ncbi:MAG: hypothetical protein IMZ52_03100 [Actinobacteria bacterium]|nr:hypothetical protein [Actinomycetota bacterium]MBE3120792.1 hypothetical protein [Thermoplasmata archaeon]
MDVINSLSTLGITLSAVVAIFSALCLYFGINTTLFHPNKSEKGTLGLYINGLFFSLIFLLGPIICYLITRSWFDFSKNIPESHISLLIVPLLPIIPLYIIIKTIQGWLYKEAISFTDYGEDNQLFFYSNRWWENKVKRLVSSKAMLWMLLFILSFASMFPTLVGIDKVLKIIHDSAEFPSITSNPIIFLITSIILAFALVTWIAIIFGYSIIKYQKVKITYEKIIGRRNNSTLEGKIMKIDENIVLKTSSGTYSINKDKIIEIQNLD